MTRDEIAEALRLHGMWQRDEPGGIRADLRRAGLRWADLSGADLRWATGNGREVMSAQIGPWPLVWTTAPDGIVTLRIGCESHALEAWEQAMPERICFWDERAPDLWAKHGDAVLAMVRAFPATPWGER